MEQLLPQNVQKEMDRLLSRLQSAGEVPSLFLHSCCAPCSSYCLEYLLPYFRITVFYYNPNIAPSEEYEKRLAEQERLIALLAPSAPHGLELLAGDYRPEEYEAAVASLQQEPEGGARCTACFRLRLAETARLAAVQGFDYFATTLTVSPHKNAPLINEIGLAAGTQYGVRYLPSDFKKKNGYLRSIQLSKEYGLYRQNYCGCKYSIWFA